MEGSRAEKILCDTIVMDKCLIHLLKPIERALGVNFDGNWTSGITVRSSFVTNIPSGGDVHSGGS